MLTILNKNVYKSVAQYLHFGKTTFIKNNYPPAGRTFPNKKGFYAEKSFCKSRTQATKAN